MQQDTPVLIVGAGPSGMIMACALHLHGVNFRIIEKRKQITQTSNALGIQARTLALLEDFNLVERFLQAGLKLSGSDLYINSKMKAGIDLSKITSPYPYVLIVPQNETEQILEQYLNELNIFVERGTDLVDFKKNNDHYEVTVENNQQKSMFNTQWIIACDGAHSKIRELDKMTFDGEDIKSQFILADAKIKTDLPLDRLHAFFSNQGILAAFPLPNQEVRLIASLPDRSGVDIEQINFSEIVSERSHRRIILQDPSWKSTFWIHSKVVQQMQENNIFFVGDSAHIHSPVGGQGMNTGMQDAHNLAWKLALVIKQLADKKILASYHAERYPVAKEIVHDTKKLTQLMLGRNFISSILRNGLLSLLLKNKKINYAVAMKISMLKINYKDSPIINYQSVISNLSPRPGTIAPAMSLQLEGKKHHLLIFRDLHPSAAEKRAIQKCVDFFAQHYINAVELHVLTYDRHSDIYATFNVNGLACCLLRPDRYLGFCSARLDLLGIKKYLRQIFSEDSAR